VFLKPQAPRLIIFKDAKSFYLSAMNTAQKVWITGASSGIGEALAYAYAKRGATVIISARRRKELERVKNACTSNSDNIYILPIDLELHQNAKSWYDEAKNAFGIPDILINNGGIGHLGEALDMQTSVERKVMEINFWGQVELSKAVLPDMMYRGSGKIVVMSSLLGHYGTAKLAAYAASKHALLGYFESLREEVSATGVKVLLVSPGFVNTQVTLNSLTESGKKYNQNSVAQEQGMDPNRFAEKLIKAINSKKNYAYIGGKELLAIPFKRIAPNLFYRVYNWMAARARKD
jgi:dehydrogenase/reductase SDR family protein 7B